MKTSTAYNPKEVESKIYALWEKNGCFKPQKSKKQPFVITIPPPNITGSLHMGHALNNTIQDILIRRKRMQGHPTLWVPGTDHAGIAAQNVVEKKLKKEDLSRHDLGREKFIERVWQWKKEYGHIIIDQLKKMGCSCDWSRERFTMDEDYAEIVNTAFKYYYDKGYIYQGERVINWCTRCQTSLSDLEVEYQPQAAKLYYFRYDKNFPIIIATTRPETKLGDVAVAVNPKDKRYKQYIGKSYNVNFAGIKRTIKIISYPNIDMKFGTGALGVTPAHSLVDFEMAQKNKLPIISVIDKFGKMNENSGQYKGLKTLEAREKIVEWLKKENLLEKEGIIDNNLSVCYRCNRPIEPILSKQWFVKMKELAKPAIEAVKSGKIKFYPSRWTKVYLDWMENVRDWCISRQIWWGHRLPVWEVELKAQMSNVKSEIKNCDIENSMKTAKLKTENYYVGDNPPKGYKQVDDVLDTWFSSALWPFAVFLKKNSFSKYQIPDTKYIKKLTQIFGADLISEDLLNFYPTSVLSTARDIIYLWVARMIFSSLEFTGEIPFEKVYIHPTVFNKEGKRMSKSLGTGVDPLELIEKYGTDATRFGLIYQNTGTQDIKFSEETILGGKKFANKIWNAARFILINIEGKSKKEKVKSDDTNVKHQASNVSLTAPDKEILAKLARVHKQVDVYLDKFQFGQAAHAIYDFFWHDLCDTYLEISKKQLEGKNLKESTQKILLYVLVESLKILHPFMPFITEEIYQNLPIKKTNKFLILSS